MPEDIPGQMPMFDAAAVSSEEALDSFDQSDGVNDSMRQLLLPAETSAGARLVGLELENFKTFEQVSVALGDFNVLVGTNNAGKSTLLQAIKLGHLLLRLHYPNEHDVRMGRTLPESILPVAAPQDLWFERRWRAGRQPVMVKITLRFSGGLNFTFGLRLLYGAVNTKLVSQPAALSPEALLRVRGTNPVLVPSSVGIVSQEEYRNAGRVSTLIQTGRHNEAVRNLLNDLQENQPRAFTILCDLVQRHFGVRIGTVRFNAEEDQFIDARYSHDGSTELDLFSAGAGLIQVVQLLAFVLRNPSSLVLLDEPDAHLHSSMQLIVIDMLEQLARQLNFQVLVSTHSKEIINHVEPSRLIPVSGARGLAPLEAHNSALAVLEELGAVDNVDLYSLFGSRRACFVEGKTDRSYLIRVASRLGSTVFEGDSRVVLIRTTGVDNFSAAAAVQVFSSLAGFQLAHLTIRDRDGLPDDKRQSLIDRAPEGTATHVHTLDCVESYLVDATGIANIAAEVWARDGKDGAPPSADDVERIIKSSTESLRDDTADRIAHALDRWYAREERKHLDAVSLNTEARAVRDAAWGELDERLKFVPGKRLLAKVRDAMKANYGVSLSDQALVDHADLDGRLAEIVALVHQIGAL